MRFKDIHDEYKRRYRKVAYKQVADNLNSLQKKEIVSHFSKFYVLSEDLTNKSFDDERDELTMDLFFSFEVGLDNLLDHSKQLNYLLGVAQLLELRTSILDNEKMKSGIVELIKELHKTLEGIKIFKKEEIRNIQP